MLQSTSEKRAERHGGKRAGAGRKDGGKWQHLISVVRADLAVIGASDSPKMVTAVIHDRKIADRSFYPDVKERTLVRYYFRFRDKPNRLPAQVKAAVPQVEKWGKLARPLLNPGDAQALVVELWHAAGAHGATWRQEAFGQIFEICARKYGVVDHEKIGWLRWCITKFMESATFFPRERPEIRDRTKRDRILKLVEHAPGKQADFDYLTRKTGWTLDAVKGQVRRLCDDRELIGTAPGVFTFPDLGMAHVPAREQVLAWFRAHPPGTEAKAVELANALGRPRQAIDSALHGHGALVRDGLIKPVRRGVFTLGHNQDDCVLGTQSR